MKKPSDAAVVVKRQASVVSIHDLNRLTRDSALILSLECTPDMLARLVVFEEIMVGSQYYLPNLDL